MPLESWLSDRSEKTTRPPTIETVTGVKLVPAGPLTSERVAVPEYTGSIWPKESVGSAIMPKLSP